MLRQKQVGRVGYDKKDDGFVKTICLQKHKVFVYLKILFGLICNNISYKVCP